MVSINGSGHMKRYGMAGARVPSKRLMAQCRSQCGQVLRLVFPRLRDGDLSRGETVPVLAQQLLLQVFRDREAGARAAIDARLPEAVIAA